jgi:hypothetical protein
MLEASEQEMPSVPPDHLGSGPRRRNRFVWKEWEVYFDRAHWVKLTSQSRRTKHPRFPRARAANLRRSFP